MCFVRPGLTLCNSNKFKRRQKFLREFLQISNSFVNSPDNYCQPQRNVSVIFTFAIALYSVEMSNWLSFVMAVFRLPRHVPPSQRKIVAFIKVFTPTCLTNRHWVISRPRNILLRQQKQQKAVGKWYGCNSHSFIT